MDFVIVSHVLALSRWILRVSHIFALWRGGVYECLVFSRSGAMDFESVSQFAFCSSGCMGLARVSHFLLCFHGLGKRLTSSALYVWSWQESQSHIFQLWMYAFGKRFQIFCAAGVDLTRVSHFEAPYPLVFGYLSSDSMESVDWSMRPKVAITFWRRLTCTINRVLGVATTGQFKNYEY